MLDSVEVRDLSPRCFSYRPLPGGIPVIFERDEERNWRALSDIDQANTKLPEAGLLQAIATSLDELL